MEHLLKIVCRTGSENNVGVWCVITRTRETCLIEEDAQLLDADAPVGGIMAWAKQDSAELHYHGMNRGFTTFSFNAQAPAPPPSDSEQVFVHQITSIAVEVPAASGSLKCSYHKLPGELANDKRHVISVVQDWIQPQAFEAGLTHHTILYSCPQEIPAQADGSEIDCDVTSQRCGSDWLNPRQVIQPNEGVPVGKDLTVALILLRHFYNPEKLVGKIDQNRWTIQYTPQLRPFEPVQIQFQTLQLNLPPKKKSIASVYMPSECTERIGLVTIVMVRFHMHDYGVAGRLRHVRETEELAPIYDMVSYKRGVSEGWLPVKRAVKPGDMLILECHFFNPLGKTVIWGEAREDEMCAIALKTKGTQVISVLSSKVHGHWRFFCNGRDVFPEQISIPESDFNKRLNFTSYTTPACASVSAVNQRYRALPSECPSGYKQPTTKEACAAAAETGRPIMDCTGWGMEPGSPPGPRCFIRTDSTAHCWKPNGEEVTKWGKTLLLCEQEGWTSPATANGADGSASAQEGNATAKRTDESASVQQDNATTNRADKSASVQGGKATTNGADESASVHGGKAGSSLLRQASPVHMPSSLLRQASPLYQSGAHDRSRAALRALAVWAAIALLCNDVNPDAGRPRYDWAAGTKL